jgi:hypothetical protein
LAASGVPLDWPGPGAEGIGVALGTKFFWGQANQENWRFIRGVIGNEDVFPGRMHPEAWSEVVATLR